MNEDQLKALPKGSIICWEHNEVRYVAIKAADGGTSWHQTSTSRRRPHFVTTSDLVAERSPVLLKVGNG